MASLSAPTPTAVLSFLHVAPSATIAGIAFPSSMALAGAQLLTNVINCQPTATFTIA